jgi:hypothetical protein
MINFLIVNETLINLVTFSVFTIGLIVPKNLFKEKIYNVILSLVFLSYCIAFFNVFLNGLIKGF